MGSRSKVCVLSSVSSLAAPSFSSAGRAIFIAHRAAYEKLQVLLCHPFEAQARRSERSRHIRHMRGSADLRSNGKVASLRSAIHRPQPSLTGAKAAAMAAAATALELASLGHRPVQRRARQDRALTLTFIGLAPWSKRNQGHPAQLHGVAATLSHSARGWEH